MRLSLNMNSAVPFRKTGGLVLCAGGRQRSRVTLKWGAANTTQMARAIKTRTSGRKSVTRSEGATSRSANLPWLIQRAGALQITKSPALTKLAWLVHGFSTRPGGGSVLDGKPALNLGFTEWDDRERVAANRRKFSSAIGASETSPLITMKQFH